MTPGPHARPRHAAPPPAADGYARATDRAVPAAPPEDAGLVAPDPAASPDAVGSSDGAGDTDGTGSADGARPTDVAGSADGAGSTDGAVAADGGGFPDAAGGSGRTVTIPRVAPVKLAASGPRHALRAVKVVWQREMIRFVRDRGRLIAGLAQPLLLLFVLGTGLSGLVRASTGGVEFTTFLFPGILATSTLFTAIFAGISIVWDREFGFLREMLVAPVPRTSILLGKCLGGATVATLQAVVLLALAGLVDVPYDPVMIVTLIGLLFLTALTITAFGLMISARIKRFQAVMPITQLVLTPMMFLSGSMFPLSGLPAWLTVLTRVNPLTYAVEPMRHVVFSHLDLDAATLHTLDPGITWNGWLVPVWLQVLLVAALGLGLLGVAAAQFRRTD
jgi:ABC-2 type transport system permease protein